MLEGKLLGLLDRKGGELMITAYDKAFAAAVVTILSLVAGHYGFKFNADLQIAVTTILTTAFVYLIPNKKIKK